MYLSLILDNDKINLYRYSFIKRNYQMYSNSIGLATNWLGILVGGNDEMT